MQSTKKQKFIFLFIFLLAFSLLAGCGTSLPQGRTITIHNPEEEEENKDGSANDSSDENEENPGALTLTMLDVGQGLSILVESDGHYMLYDGGGRDSSSYVVAYMKSHGIQKFDYLVASHYDEDHIAGLIGVLYNYEVTDFLCPDYQADSKIYQSLQSALEKKGTEVIHPQTGEVYRLGNLQISILGPLTYDEEKENNNSIAAKIVCGDFSAVLTGDAEKEEEQAILDSGADLSADLYVVGHHGSSGSTSENFLKAISPSIAWISCGADNSYGHPAEKTMEKLKNAGIPIYRTDKQGEITCYSDGNTYWFDQDSCGDYSAGEKRE